VRKARAWLKLKALAGRRWPRLRVAALRRFLRKNLSAWYSNIATLRTIS